MKIIQLTFCFFLISSNLFGQNEYIYWSETKKLEYDDFQCEYDTSISKNNMHASISKIGLKVVFNSKTNNIDCYQLKAVFYKNESCMIKNDIFLIEHEQLHFDLMEIQARKLRKRISEKEIDINKIDLNEEINSLINEYNDINDKYDIETSHGTNIQMQLQWILMVREELKKLEKYVEEVLICLPN